MMKNVLVNLLKATSGGGKNILDNYLECLFSAELDYNYYILTPNYNYYKKYSKEQIIIINEKKISNRNLLFLKLYFFDFKKIVRKYKIDIIFNFGDVIVPNKKVKQIYFFDWAYALYNESYIWRRMSLKNYVIRKIKVILIKKYIKNVSLVIVQTNNMEKRMKRIYGVKNIVTKATPLDSQFHKIEKEYDFHLSKDKIKFLFPAIFTPHKNFSILSSLTKLINEENLPFKIILTLNEKEENKLFSRIKKRDRDVLINVGRQTRDYMPSLYQQTDVLFLPTLLESYGLPYIEALKFQKPIITSDLDFAREICKDYALYFNPFEENSILSKMKISAENHKNPSLETTNDMPLPNNEDWESVFNYFQSLIHKIE